jgi:predicted NAD-dependent protein-ADP-ribosyltransferase YbiA (DUF1768 family)
MAELNDIIKFYSKSADKKPCKGTGEVYVSGYDYTPLSKIKDWRKILSNFHLFEFEWNGLKWLSIEHAYQSAKISLMNKEKAYHFSVNSGHDIGKSDAVVAQKNRKYVKLSDEKIKEWGLKSNNIMEEIAIAKYSQCKEACEVLKMTGNAELWHVVSRKSPVRFLHLEKIRKGL